MTSPEVRPTGRHLVRVRWLVDYTEPSTGVHHPEGEEHQASMVQAKGWESMGLVEVIA